MNFFLINFLFFFLLKADYDKIVEHFQHFVIQKEDHHQDFSGIAYALSRNKFIQEASFHLHAMSLPFTNPLFLDEAECAASSNELLTNDFLNEIGILKEDSLHNSDELSSSIQKALKNAKFSEEQIEKLICHLFKKKQPTEEEDGFFLLNGTRANDNCRRFGFPLRNGLCDR